MKFIVQQSKERPDHHLITDKENGIVLIFKKGDFNDSQQVVFLDNADPEDFMQHARSMRLMADYLQENIPELL